MVFSTPNGPALLLSAMTLHESQTQERRETRHRGAFSIWFHSYPVGTLMLSNRDQNRAHPREQEGDCKEPEEWCVMLENLQILTEVPVTWGGYM